MTKLKDLFLKDINRPFEGVIKADDQEHLLLELEEYVVTREISDKLYDFFEAYNAESGKNGVWLSGFFGSGKSHLLKILSHLLENKEIDGQKVADIFLPKIEDALLKAEVEKALRIRSKSILFNIDQKSDTQNKKQTDAILSVFMKVFNEMQGYYPKHGFVAELEHGLHKKGILEPFKARFAEITGESWEEGRDSLFLESDNFARALAEVSDISKTEATKVLDRYEKEYTLTIELFAQRVKEWLDQQPAGFRLNFFVDEIGQYISENTKLMLNLQTIVESLATICEGRAWVIVTSQENVEEVLGEMSSRQSNDFSRIQDRFRTRIMLTSANADEVIQKRMLAKKPARLPDLAAIYEKEGNNLKTLFRFGGGSRTYKSFSDERHFGDCYPFLPYQFELFHASSTGLSRQRAFTGKHRSVGERSMLDVFRQVLIKNQGEDLNRLMSFDAMFQGLEATIKSQFRTGITVAEQHLGDPLAIRVLKALFLVKYVKEFKATPQNIAALLVDHLEMDLPAHEAKVQEALNRLEQETYIQRNEEVYEYLTDEEKDVEEAIKSTELEPTAVKDILAKIVFADLLSSTRLRYDPNKQDYNYSRILDEDLRGREYELGLHVVSPVNPNYLNTDALAAQTMGRPELLLLMGEDKRLVQDLRMYLQTEKYVLRENSSSLSESRKRIIAEKALQNNQRRQYLFQRIEKCLSRGDFYLNGSELKLNPQQALPRLKAAFQHLVAYAYPRLAELSGGYKEEDLPLIIHKKHDDLFAGDEASLSVPEQELLTRLRRNKAQAERSSLRRMIDTFESRPYGWYQTGILVMIARLYKRGLVELMRDSQLLEDESVLESLRNNRLYANTYLKEVAHVDPENLRRLRTFFHDFLHEACPEQEPKAAALALRDRLVLLGRELEEFLRQQKNYPFLKALAPLAKQLEGYRHKAYDFFLTQLSEFENELLDAREDLLDPIEQFMRGQQREIYDEIRDFLNRGEANLEHLSPEQVQPLHDLLANEHPYRGGAMQKGKNDLDASKQALLALVGEEKGFARELIGELMQKLQSSPEYSQLDAHQQQTILQPFLETQQSLEIITLIPVIRDRLRRAENEAFPQALDRMTRLVQKPKPPQPVDPPVGEGPGRIEEPVPPPPPPPRITYVTRNSIKPVFEKPYLETEAEVDAYLEALKQRYLRIVRDNKRISL